MFAPCYEVSKNAYPFWATQRRSVHHDGSLCIPENETEDVPDFTVCDIDVPEVCLKGIRGLNNVPDICCVRHITADTTPARFRFLSTSLRSHATTSIFIYAYVNRRSHER